MSIPLRFGSKGSEGTMMVDAGALRSRCLEGEEPAWRELHAQYLPVAHTFLRHLGVPGSELDDACQEVFVQVFRYLARFEERAEFKTWLYKLCISQAGRVRRRAGIVAAVRRVLAPAGEEPVSDSDTSGPKAKPSVACRRSWAVSRRSTGWCSCCSRLKV